MAREPLGNRRIVPPSVHQLQYGNQAREHQIQKEISRRWRWLRFKRVMDWIAGACAFGLVLLLLLAWVLKVRILRMIFGP